MEGDEYLAQTLSALGFVGYGAMGAVPIAWGELAAYMDITQTYLTPWEAQTVMLASAAYAVQSQKSHKSICIEPNRQRGESDGIDVFSAIKSIANKNGDISHG